MRVLGDRYIDAYGNVLEDGSGQVGVVIEDKLGSTAAQASTSTPVTPGVTRGQAPIVDYPNFVEPGKQPKASIPTITLRRGWLGCISIAMRIESLRF